MKKKRKNLLMIYARKRKTAKKQYVCSGLVIFISLIKGYQLSSTEDKQKEGFKTRKLRIKEKKDESDGEDGMDTRLNARIS